MPKLAPRSRSPRMTAGLASGLALVALTASPLAADEASGPAPAIAAPDAETIRILYNGYFSGFRIMKASVDAQLTDEAYTTQAVFRTAGLAGWFKTAQIHADASGRMEGQRAQPEAYAHRNLASKKNRRIAMDFVEDDVISTITPPFGSMGQPPATQDQRAGALDPISAFLALAREGGTAPCARTLPVYDGKQRYDLRVEYDGEEDLRVRGYSGATVRCRIFYEPIAGFDPEDLADDDTYATPVVVWLAPLGEDFYAPVRFTTRMSGARVTIEAKDIERVAGGTDAAL